MTTDKEGEKPMTGGAGVTVVESARPMDAAQARADRPAVSVVVATRNRPHLLSVAIGSIAAQTYPGVIETIVVFDQCDPSHIVESDDPLRPVRITRTTDRVGLAAARNTGADLASGEFLAFLDDDDEWEPAKIERQVSELERSGAHVCVTGITIARDNRRVVRVPSAQELTIDSLIAHRVVAAHPSSVLVKKASFLGPIGVVDEEIPGSYGEDYDWLLRAARLGPIAVVGEPLVLVHWGKQSYFADRWQTIIDANDYLVAKHPEFAASRIGMARLHGRRAIALAALGKRREARVWARKALKLSPRDRRAYLAFVLSTGVVKVDTVMQLANRAGRGL
ncbi:MAG TPA: glycosyltransferase [Frankiaceae bacterium]|nr:glycosyltransferase [Frankiaceae bacterium]